MFVVSPIVCGILDVSSLFCFVVCYVVSSFAIISLGKRELDSLLLLCSERNANVIVLWPFLGAQCVGLLYEIVAFPGHIHFLFAFSGSTCIKVIAESNVKVEIWLVEQGESLKRLQ